MDQCAVVFQKKWANRRQVKQVYSLSKNVVYGWLEAGYIRSLKAGQSRQSQRLYSVQDIERVIQALSEGRQPKVVRTRPSRRVQRGART